MPNTSLPSAYCPTPVRDAVVRFFGNTATSQTRRLAADLFSGYASKIWAVLVNLICIPLYVRRLGPEPYGLVAFSLSLQSLAVLLDFGISNTISRELSSRLAAGRTNSEIRDVARTLEVIYWLIGITIGALIAILGPLLAHHWLQLRELSADTAKLSIDLMGLTIAVSWAAPFYIGGLLGIHRQALSNGLAIFVTAARYGIPAALALARPGDLLSFVAAQALAGAISVGILRLALWRSLPHAPHRPRCSLALLRQMRRMIAGMGLATFLTLLYLQVDKLLLSKLLPLDQFGFYSLAWTVVAGSFYLIYYPVGAVLFPRFAHLAVTGGGAETRRLYHFGVQAIAGLAIPSGVLLAVFPNELLNGWLRQPAVAKQTAPLLSLLAIFTIAACLSHVPMMYQWAVGSTKPTTTAISASLVLLPAALYAGVKLGGPIGAIIAWGLLRVAQCFFVLEWTHFTAFSKERWPFYRDAVLRPSVVAAGGCLGFRALWPADAPLLLLASLWLMIVSLSFLWMPVSRKALSRFVEALERRRVLG